MEAESPKTTQELATDGQKRLEETIEAASQILSSNGDEVTGGDGAAALPLHEARLRFKSSVAAFRAVLVAIPDSQKATTFETGSAYTTLASLGNEAEIEQLEAQVSTLRKELMDKNTHLNLLIDKLRDLITDVSTWKTSCTT